MTFGPSCTGLDFHLGHIDTRRAVSLTALTRHTQIQRFFDLWTRETFGTELTRKRQAQRIRASTRQVLLVLGDAIARTHRAGIKLAAMSVVIAHLDG